MKAKVYMRLARSPRARDGFKVDASTSPNPNPLTIGQYPATSLHTLRFAVVLDIPDHLLKPADWPVIEVALDADEIVRIPIEVTPEAVS